MNNIGHAIEKYVDSQGKYGILKEYGGHGIGTEMHQEPHVLNFGKAGNGPEIIPGMALAIEPMINLGTKNIKQHKDGWTITTADNKPSAHFEHDVALVDGKPELLSTFKYIYDAMGIVSNEEDEFRKDPTLI